MQVIHELDDMNIAEALECYALGKQGANGDIEGEAPPFWQANDFALYQAWASQRGKSMADAQREFIDKMGPVISKKGLKRLRDVTR